jgi:hypothetical protein
MVEEIYLFHYSSSNSDEPLWMLNLYHTNSNLLLPNPNHVEKHRSWFFRESQSLITLLTVFFQKIFPKKIVNPDRKNKKKFAEQRMRLGGRIEKKKRLFSNPKPAKTARCVALGALD